MLHEGQFGGGCFKNVSEKVKHALGSVSKVTVLQQHCRPKKHIGSHKGFILISTHTHIVILAPCSATAGLNLRLVCRRRSVSVQANLGPCCSKASRSRMDQGHQHQTKHNNLMRNPDPQGSDQKRKTCPTTNNSTSCNINTVGLNRIGYQ